MANTEAAPAASETTQPPVAPAASVETPSGTTATPPETVTPAEAAKTYTQEEMDRITAKVKKNAAYRARKEAEAYYKGLQQGTTLTAPKPQEPAAPKEPQRDQFASYEEFIEARADYRADIRVAETLSKRTDKEEQNKAQERFLANLAEVVKERADAQEILESSEAPLTNSMRDAIHASDAPARIAVYLAENPDDAQRIAALSSAKQAVEIGKLDARLAKPNGSAPASTTATPAIPAASARTPSKAPAPIRPVGGTVAVGEDMPDPRTSPDKWMEWRNNQLRQRMSAGRKTT